MDEAGDLDFSGWGCKARRGLDTQESTIEDSFTFERLLPALPDELTLQCLARVSDVGPLREVCKRWKNVVQTSEEFVSVRAEVGQKVIDWLYVMVRSADGTYSWQAFDPVASKWHELPPMPEEIDFQLSSPGSIGLTHHVQCVSTGKKLVMLAGLKLAKGDTTHHQWAPLEPALEHPWVFDPIKCQWKKGCPFKIPRRWCVCGVVGDKVYVASGCGLLWNMSLSKSTDMYDPEADSWEALPLTLESSKFSGEAIPAVNVAGKLYIVSGRGVFMKVGAVFCSSSRKWSRMPEGLRVGWVGSCVAVDDKFYVVEQFSGRLSVYDPQADRWKTVLENPRLKGLYNLTSGKGKICGIVGAVAGRPLEEEKSSLRIVNFSSNPPSIRELEVPHGRVVSAQVLARMKRVRS
ncbi:unnamed protein product [Calypogeia fissa]